MAAKVSSRTSVDVVNQAAFNVAVKAVKETKKADRDKIAHKLGQIGTTLALSKKGKFKRRKGRLYGSVLVTEDSYAAKLVNWFRKKHGLEMLHGEKLLQEAGKLITNRRRGVGMIAAGWLYAIRDLASKTGRSNLVNSGMATFGKRKGRGREAKFNGQIINGTIKASIENSALIKSGGYYQGMSGNPEKYAEEGLKSAMQSETRSIMDHLSKKMQQSLTSAGIKTA